MRKTLLPFSPGLATALLIPAVDIRAAVATITMIVGLFAAFGPARQALRSDAAEALRTDG